MGASLRDIDSHLVEHTSSVNLARGFLYQDMDRNINIYLRTIVASVRDRTAGLRSATSNVGEMHSTTLLQDVSSMLTFLDGRLQALASEHCSRRLPIAWIRARRCLRGSASYSGSL